MGCPAGPAQAQPARACRQHGCGEDKLSGHAETYRGAWIEQNREDFTLRMRNRVTRRVIRILHEALLNPRKLLGGEELPSARIA